MNLHLPHLVFVFCYLLSMSADAITVNVQVTDVSDNPLKNIVVYIDPLDGQRRTISDKTIDIGQLNKSFTPYISVIQQGNTVRFHNQDDITHHIYSVTGENKFSIKIRSGQQKIKQDINHLGEVAMGCNIHDWMSGYLLVLDTPYFDKTNVKGDVSIDVPASGNYQVTVWHPQMSEANNRISETFVVKENILLRLKLHQDMADIPLQKSDDDFFFLSEY